MTRRMLIIHPKPNPPANRPIAHNINITKITSQNRLSPSLLELSSYPFLATEINDETPIKCAEALTDVPGCSLTEVRGGVMCPAFFRVVVIVAPETFPVDLIEEFAIIAGSAKTPLCANEVAVSGILIFSTATEVMSLLLPLSIK